MRTTLNIFLMILVTINFAHALDSEAYRQGCRQRIIAKSEGNFNKGLTSPIKENDDAKDLVDNSLTMIKSLKKMDELNLAKGRSLATPWSDSYWPLYRGGLGQRYQDSEIMGLGWEELISYISKNSVVQLIKENKFAELSPSEKYDMIFGLNSLPLTNESWNEGNRFYREYGKVESWMGLCHGWAPASFMVPEPKKKVLVKAPFGDATFYPSDIKGLATMLWAKGQFKTRFIGNRCNSQKPREDRYGRPAENECLDNNPGTWHMVVVNQLGISKRPFIMDASFDHEVWNHPVFSYEYTYFNPITRKRTGNLSEAIVKHHSWNDPRAKLRSSKTSYIVGVAMNVAYGVENEPSIKENQESLDSEIQYEYDLELDDKYEIVGGEWYTRFHPDFLWVPVRNAFPSTYSEDEEFKFDFMNIDPEVKNIVLFNSQRSLPWGPFLKGMINLSSK